MCGRYASFLPPELIARLFGTVNPLPNLQPTWNLAPTDDAPLAGLTFPHSTPLLGIGPAVSEDFSPVGIVFITREAFLNAAIVMSKVTLITLSIGRSNSMDSFSGVNSTR